MKRFYTIGLLAIVAAAGGCFAVGGSDRFESRQPTIGRQLQDLRVARDTGAIDQAEFETVKAALIASAGK